MTRNSTGGRAIRTSTLKAPSLTVALACPWIDQGVVDTLEAALGLVRRTMDRLTNAARPDVRHVATSAMRALAARMGRPNGAVAAMLEPETGQ